MPLFQCYIRGENFPMTLDGKFRLMGFYTTRWVDAPDAEAAELLGLDMLRDEFRFSVEERHKAPEAKVYFEEIEEVPSDTARNPNKGATWFEMEDQ